MAQLQANSTLGCIPECAGALAIGEPQAPVPYGYDERRWPEVETQRQSPNVHFDALAEPQLESHDCTVEIWLRVGSGEAARGWDWGKGYLIGAVYAEQVSTHMAGLLVRYALDGFQEAN